MNMKAIIKTIILFTLVITLASCNASAPKSRETPIPTVTSLPTSTSTTEPTDMASPLLATPIPPTQTPYFPVPFNHHDPEAVLRAYFDAWNRNDWKACESLGGRCNEPVESVRILEIHGSCEYLTECIYSVLFEIKVVGKGVSMHTGQYPWSYYLTWDANRDTWYISNYGFG